MHMLSVYDEAKLKEEDAYDDSEYQAYETMDYTSEDEETKEQQDEEKTRALRKRLMNQEDELFDFYKTDAKIKKGMESKEFYAQHFRRAERPVRDGGRLYPQGTAQQRQPRRQLRQRQRAARGDGGFAAGAGD